MSWICVVGINVVVDAEKKYGELVDVCIPRPRRTSRDSSIGMLVHQCMSSVEPGARTCVLAPHAKIQDSEAQGGNGPPIEYSGNSSCGILDGAEGD
jgi:hypothetical protein